MRHSALAALAVLPVAFGGARLLYSGPEDPYAFPKYRVTFLNDLPVLNETAQRWTQDGLRGGEREFLDEPWDTPAWYPQSGTKEIGSSEAGAPHETPTVCTFDMYPWASRTDVAGVWCSQTRLTILSST